MRADAATGRCRDCFLKLEHARLDWSPRFDPSRITVTVPAQDVRLSVGELNYRSQADGQANLNKALLQSLRVFARAGSFKGPDDTRCALSLSLELNGTQGAERASQVTGRLNARGDNAAPLIAALGARAALQWMFPEALDAQFSLSTALAVSAAAVELTDIQAHVGSLDLSGGLTWNEVDGARGALLVSTGVRRVGLKFEQGDVKPELTPSQDWLSRALSRKPSHVDAASGAGAPRR